MNLLSKQQYDAFDAMLDEMFDLCYNKHITKLQMETIWNRITRLVCGHIDFVAYYALRDGFKV